MLTKTVKYHSDTVGQGILRVDLEISPFGSKFVVVHQNLGLLSYLAQNRFWFKIYEPVCFGEEQRALQWINEGCIAEIQESLSELNVRFISKSIMYRGTDYE